MSGKMSVTDLLTRAEGLCKKYEKYDVDRKEDMTAYKNDRFMQMYVTIQADIEAAMQKANDVSIEKNRALVATMNAELRRAKVALMDQIPKLTKYAGRKVKEVTKENLALRPDMVLGLTAKIEQIPDGVVGSGNQVKGKKGKGAATVETIKIDVMTPEQLMSGGNIAESSEDSTSFAQEANQRRAKQDESMEVISEGLTTLGNMAQDINEELEKQTTLVDEIGSKVDKAHTEMKSTNARLKETLVKLRSGRNLVVDVVLLIVIMSIAAALYKVIMDKKNKKSYTT